MNHFSRLSGNNVKSLFDITVMGEILIKGSQLRPGLKCSPCYDKKNKEVIFLNTLNL